LGGGTGKSTTAVNLGHALALQGRNTLIVDTDRQSTDAVFLGQEPDAGLSRWLGSRLMGLDASLSEQITTSGRMFLDLLPDSQETDKLQKMLVAAETPVTWLRSQVSASADVFEQYDFVLWDTSPAGRLLDIVLFLADLVILPTPADIKGQASLADTLQILPPSVTRIILPTRVQPRQSVPAAFLGGFTEDYADSIFRVRGVPAFVPERAAVRTAQAMGRTIFEHDPFCDVAGVYAALAGAVAHMAGKGAEVDMMELMEVTV